MEAYQDGFSHSAWSDASGMPVQWADSSDSSGPGQIASLSTHDLYRFAMELGPTMPWLADAQGVMLEMDPRIFELTGREKELCLGRGFQQSVHCADMDMVMAAWRRGQDDLQPFDYDLRILLRDGNYRWHRVRAVPFVEDGRVRCWYGTFEDFHERRMASDAVRWVADHDELTGLLNRRAFIREVRGKFAAPDRDESETVLVLLDIDRLKPINERFGNEIGDKLLCHVASRLGESFGSGVLLARTNGDEFALCLSLPVGSDRDSALMRAQEVFSKPFLVQGRQYDIGASIGMALHPRDAENADALFKTAEFALFEAKTGVGVVRQFDASMREQHQRRLSALFVAREALAQKRIFPFYQPQVDLVTGEVVGFEALLRWEHKRHGIQPAAMISGAFEDAELAAALDLRMFEQIVEDIREWRAKGVPFGRVAINTSVVRFRAGSIAGELLRRIEEGGLSPDMLELEITEDVLIDRAPEQLARDMLVLREAGMTIALDDFGTGFASLIHLKEFAIDVLKIDRAFMQDMDDRANGAIVAALVRLGKRLSIRTVAEGVETARQAQLLRLKGCDIGQGFLFSPAVPARDVAELIRSLANDASTF
ncbi:MAG TPA: GGDEF and EAL domain-containing protein [Novosphingobium sp.]